MSKKKKIIIGIISAIILILIGGLAFLGNYFFNYALVRQEGIVTQANVDPKAPQSVETSTEIVNKEKSKEDVENWLKYVKSKETTIVSNDGIK